MRHAAMDMRHGTGRVVAGMVGVLVVCVVLS
jgi:hypothetical protein